MSFAIQFEIVEQDESVLNLQSNGVDSCHISIGLGLLAVVVVVIQTTFATS